jgi:hypothetical protein
VCAKYVCGEIGIMMVSKTIVLSSSLSRRANKYLKNKNFYYLLDITKVNFKKSFKEIRWFEKNTLSLKYIKVRKLFIYIMSFTYKFWSVRLADVL